MSEDTTRPVVTASRPLDDDGRTPLALAAGLAAALVAGGIWAALVFVTNMEIGFVAWGVGLLVGLAMSRVTAERSQQLAYIAAALAILGLAAGKVFIVAGSSGMVARELEENEEMLRGAVAWQMYEERTLEAQTLEQVDAVQAAGDTLSDALWGEMLAQAGGRIAQMSPDEKHEVALVVADGALQGVGMLGGVLAQLSLYDLLWLFLAVGTAYRMLAPGKEQPAPPAPAVPV